MDNPNGVNCNNYQLRTNVFISGGPEKKSDSPLPDGDYFFTVMVPGSESNLGFLFGGEGNLSDTGISGVGNTDDTAGAPIGDEDINYINHIFTVSNGVVSYAGNHCTIDVDGKKMIQLSPYDFTSNNGGVYTLAVCRVGATGNDDCKFDNFRIAERPGNPNPPVPPAISGMKYYDGNANGQFDAGEVGIANWPIVYDISLNPTSIMTDVSGIFFIAPPADSYKFAEVLAGSPWIQTGNIVDQTSVTGVGASVILNPDKSYDVIATNDSTISSLNFGNLCIGKGGGLTLGFWSNKNGQAIMNASLPGDLSMLVALHLRTASGANFDPATYAQFRTWILGATATNMAYMLSAQLAAMELNVSHGKVNGAALIYAPGTASANVNGFAIVNDVMAEANAALGADGLTQAGDPNRTIQEALKNALDRANNNQTFVQAGPDDCPLPPAKP